MSISSLNRNMLRLTGLSSGLDTESIVSGLIKIDQMKVDKQFRAKTKLEWQGDAYRDVNLKLRNFREKHMSVLSEDNIFSSAAFKSYKTSVTGNTSAVDITAGASAFTGSMTIEEITQLAEAATVKSSNVFDGNLDTKLKEIEGLEGEYGRIAFKINNKHFSFDGETTVNDMINAVNRETGDTGVTMAYSSLRKGFTFANNETGEDSHVSIINVAGNAFSGDGPAFGIREGSYFGQNAKLKVDGVELSMASNSFTIDGIGYNLKTTSDEPITFSVERDLDEVVDKIASFVDGYNELIGELQAMLDEKVYRDYAPLTNDERSQLSESEVKLWDEKAKSGLLRNDSHVRQLLTDLRSSFYNKVAGAGLSAVEVGLSTTANYLDGGQISVDKDALRKALEKDPAKVESLFINVSEATDASTKYNESGLITRISDSMLNFTKTITEVTLASNTRALKQADEQLTKLEEWLLANENKYWKQFAAMETAMSQLNSQNGWISSMLGQS